MQAWWRKTQAKLVLAGLFFVHLFQRVIFFWKKGGGVKAFLENYGPDGIFPVSSSERSHFASFQWCQTCSLCTFSCEAIKNDKAPPSFEPKFLMLGFGRSAHESEYFLETWLPCLECKACSVLCPNDVPVHQMAEQIIERRKQVAFRK